MRLRRLAIPAAWGLVCAGGILVYFWIEIAMRGNRGTDFNQFYSAAQLVGSGELYNWERLQKIELAHHPRTVMYGRFPFQAAAFKLISWLPYDTARLAWWTFNVLALFSLPWIWQMPNRWLVTAALCWSCPVWALLNFGQDTGIFLLLASLGVRLLKLRRGLLAGLLFSLCTIKFHLGLGIAVYLLARRCWRAVAGACIGTALILAISFALEGSQWPLRLWALRSAQGFDPPFEKMPTFAGLVGSFPYSRVFWFLLAAAAVVLLWRAATRQPLEVGALGCALPVGLLLSPHALVYDGVLLLPATLIAFRQGSPRVLIFWAALMFTPLPYFLLMDGHWAGRLLAAGFALGAIVLLALRPPLPQALRR